MAILPETGEQNWGPTLNNYIRTALDENGGIYTFANESERDSYFDGSTAYKTLEQGNTCILSQESKIQKYDGVAWQDIFAGGGLFYQGTTADNTPTEIFLGGVADSRLPVQANSIITFDITASARDNTSGDCGSFQIKGGIKRDGGGNTTLLDQITKIILSRDDANWDVNVEADDTNDALVIKVVGDDANQTQWQVKADITEVEFDILFG